MITLFPHISSPKHTDGLCLGHVKTLDQLVLIGQPRSCAHTWEEKDKLKILTAFTESYEVRKGQRAIGKKRCYFQKKN